METLDQLIANLQEAKISYGETYAEHANETSVFGDSGPGTQDTLAHSSEIVAKAKAAVEAHPEYIANQIAKEEAEAGRKAAMANYVPHPDCPF